MAKPEFDFSVCEWIREKLIVAVKSIGGAWKFIRNWKLFNIVGLWSAFFHSILRQNKCQIGGLVFLNTDKIKIKLN